MAELSASPQFSKQGLYKKVNEVLLPSDSELSDDYREYLTNLAQMHFEGGARPSGSTVGIQMQQEKPLDGIRDLLGIYCQQTLARGNGNGLGQLLRTDLVHQDRVRHDDRAVILAHGGACSAIAKPETGISYHLLEVAGTLKVATVAEASAVHQDSTLVKLSKTPKGQFSLELVESDNSAGIPTSWATMIIGPEGGESGKLKIYTIHAGLPMAPLPLGIDSRNQFVYFDTSQVSQGLDEYLRDLLQDQGSFSPKHNSGLQDSSASMCITLTLRQARCLFGSDVAVRIGADASI